ncbi:hypothetical protein O2N63_03130 [Aliiroseovarius sp. KMU-50]|uniref:Uncharacterized protein n=1 Tax=Aliiroseovarius salicola TaxID=3009082 RepID=A0ABT4VXU0_9RHOB|nr:hypothetical protein [Aliiroseovarius sp. KMU-50]MDA5093071.1 hypothetical protein [Aliiroseovarius sp. KMU-50]
MTLDTFKRRSAGITSPASNAFSVTPDDANDLPVVTRGLYLGETSTVQIVLQGDDTPVTFTNLIGGVVHPLRVKRVYATGSTATDIVGIY